MTDTRTHAKSLTVFRSRLNEAIRPEYVEMAQAMVALAKTMPGFLSIKTFTAEDGERVSLVEFATAAEEQAWANHPEHGKAMDKGRSSFFSDYNIKVCTVERELVPR
ncbi:MAG TPA: antibiotic biosynthesis monooxygenase [Burkholderiaceae bacterium]|jgi:heme-degrading monooxygenase HmoA